MDSSHQEIELTQFEQEPAVAETVGIIAVDEALQDFGNSISGDFVNLQDVTPAPEGWVTNSRLAKQSGVAFKTTRDTADRYREECPEWFSRYKDDSGHINEHYSPELADTIFQEVSKLDVAPGEWLTNKKFSRSRGSSQRTISNLAEPFREEHPEWFRYFRDKSGKRAEHYSPELLEIISEKYSSHETAPNEWLTNHALSKSLECDYETSKRLAEPFREEHPEWFKDFKIPHGSLREHYHPDLIEQIKLKLDKRQEAPEGWVTNKGLSRMTGNSPQYISRIANSFRENQPDWFRDLSTPSGVFEHYSPEAIRAIIEELSKYEPAPEGWLTNRRLAKKIERSGNFTRKLARDLTDSNLEWIATYKDKSGRPFRHYSPELVENISRIVSEMSVEKDLNYQKGIEKLALQADVESFLSHISEDKTLDAQEFKNLIQLFGGENVVDILFQYRPDYQKIDMPYVRRIIGEYLGEFLTIRGGLELEDLEASVGYLGNSNLKNGLIEVIKNDCLRFYNEQRLAEPDHDDLVIIAGYISNLRQQTEAYSTPELLEVLNEVEKFYTSLFEIEKPEYMVDELNDGRSFPDLNQRINIKEIELKKKMLIADEMGVGKSASAILAKETLGVKQALIVVPSNVVEVWLKYLSDQQAENGDAEGYFKQGQAPQVLVIEGLEALRGVSPEDYDYVILSQERLTAGYVEELERFDYRMLIVDEVHKLKNISYGRWAENLVKLASSIDFGDQEKYLALLSGTPVPNTVGDIAMLLKLLYPSRFEEVPNKELTRLILNGDVLNLRSLLVPRMQMKSLAESIEMPKLHEEIHEIEMSEQEKDVYGILIEEDELVASEKIRILRQFLLNPTSAKATPFVESTKLAEVSEALNGTFSNKNKVIMFVNDYIEGVIRGEETIFEELNLPPGVEIHVIHGEVSKAKRLEIQQMLHQNDRKILLAVSGQTAGVGVDFSGAEEVYFYNEPWTKYDKQQQQGRVYRPGLKDDLISHTFYVKGTIEEGIHKYIEVKYQAIEKLLRGIPLSELEQELLKQDKRQVTPNLEVNASLAENYFTVWDKMMKIFGYVREIGEPDFLKFAARYGREYAECYTELGSRSYQANANRLAGTVIDNLAKAKKQEPEFARILDVASGPEMLRRHISEEYQDQVVSVDINAHHFDELDDKRRVGSFLDLPIADSSVDYANLSLALHYTRWTPSKNIYERVEVLKELNRVLVNEGVAVITMMHTLDLKDQEMFKGAVEKIGFKVIERYSGKTEGGKHFHSRVMVLQKVRDCPKDTRSLVQAIGGFLTGLKFQKQTTKLRDTRKIVTSFSIGERRIKVKLNQADQRVLEEEEAILAMMKALKRQYKKVEKIPSDQIYTSDLVRAHNGRAFVLFKRLQTGSGAVITS